MNIQNNLVLELHIPDFAPVREFYSKFGFKELSYDPTSGGGSNLGYLVLLREDPIGNTMLNFYGDSESVTEHAHFKDFPSNTPRGYGVEITISVSNVQTLWESIQETIDSKEISQELTIKRWGQKDFRIIDPFGYYVRFTEPVDWGQ